MRTKRDFRVQRTYDALMDGFKSLLLKKPFEAITIKELCETARIRPATFYTHFKDKYDFFAFMAREIREQHFMVSAQPEVFEHSRDYFIYMIKHGFDFIEENESFLKTLETDSMLTIILHSVTDSMNAEIQKYLENDQKHGAILLAEPELLTQFFIGSMTQCTRWWLDHRKSVSKNEMIKKLSDVINKCVYWPELDG